MRSSVAILVTLIIAAIVGIGAYQLGVAQGLATTGGGTAVAPAYYYHPFFGGFGFLGLLFPLLFIFLTTALGVRATPTIGASASRSSTTSCTAAPLATPDRRRRRRPPAADPSFTAWTPEPVPASSRGAGFRPMKRVLIVDDEPKIVALARDYLERAGFAVATAYDGKTALASARGDRPDLVVLDLGLPVLDGLDVARTLRAESPVPIVMLTGRTEESDKLVGLEIGADDYVTKPFSPKELVARVRAVLRRSERPVAASDIVSAGAVTLDIPRMRVTVDERVIELTPTEFQLLATLARDPGRVFTRSQLLDAVHGIAFESYERAIDAHVKNIRRKLEPDPAHPRYLLTVYGVGYRFAEQE